ncbi:MAG: flagellar biosynthesis protein FlhA [Deltaproteobacteria bacterium]|nr:flagellar biosynthesis protein FlhA [Deltaproteobacteria bacterium]MBW2468225.1 flagellar biosynthesis protein FlhA [Deltaproteobacteria bacterium]MBW2486395.1 flagellar biosynthesis protein FlhA [Deltaproteobacteria bacterium]
MAVAVVGILIFMVMPLPTFLLDLLLSFSITFSLIILLASMYVQRPLDLSSFPSILLLATLFRLSLNVASTRIILLHGNEGTLAAGKVIQAFGSFVVGGNYLVGIIVFLILVAINFMVITKGAGRIAEVAARFTLDGMPGKQMSIDADLNAGLITEQEARERRDIIAQEAEYYGAMDGANKFVRGDAVAGIVITLINIIGGLAIGIFQNKMSFVDAAQNYTLLTIGDGLVTQVPALIVSTAAGVIVTRAGAASSLGEEISSQILIQPKAIAVAAGVLFGFGLVPGLPTIPFLVLAVLAGGLAYSIFQSIKERSRTEEAAKISEEKALRRDPFEALPPLDTLAIEVGYGLIPLVDIEQDGQLLDRIKSLRRQIARELGVIVAPVHIQDNMRLKAGEYSILLKGNEVAKGELLSNYYLAMNPNAVEEKIDGIPTREPTYGLPALWIKEDVKEHALTKGFTVVDLATVLTTHLSEVVKQHCHEMLGRQDVQQLLDTLKETHPKVVEELVPNLLPLGGVVRVLQNLLREQVPIRDLLAICETLADWAPVTKDLDILSEHVRHALARTITKMHLTPEGNISAITLGHTLETAISGALQQTEHGTFLSLDPPIAQQLMNNLAASLEKLSSLDYQPVVMCSSQIRQHVKRLVDRFMPRVTVLSYDEILSNVEIQSLDVLELNDAD